MVIEAIATDVARTDTEASGGGLVSGNGSNAEAYVTSVVKAYIGDNAEVHVTNNASLRSDASTDADAKAEGTPFRGPSAGGSAG